MAEYTKREIAERIGEPVRKLHWWVREGLVVPDVAPSSGRGVPLIFSERNLIEFMMLKIMLAECQLSLSAIKAILDELRKAHAGDKKFSFARTFYEDVSSEEWEKYQVFSEEWGHTLDIIYVYQHQHQESHMMYEAVRGDVIRNESGKLKIMEPKPVSRRLPPEELEHYPHVKKQGNVANKVRRLLFKDDNSYFEEVHPPSFEEVLESNISVTLIRLGKIKNQAIKRLGMN